MKKKQPSATDEVEDDPILYSENHAECPHVILSEDDEKEEEKEEVSPDSTPLIFKKAKKHILQVSSRQQYRRLDDLFAKFCETAEFEDISTAQLAGQF